MTHTEKGMTLNLEKLFAEQAALIGDLVRSLSAAKGEYHGLVLVVADRGHTWLGWGVSDERWLTLT